MTCKKNISNNAIINNNIIFFNFQQFGRNPEDLPFCLFAQTFVFVAYNKVVTSQYFLWYLSLIPLVIPKLKLSKYESVTSLLLWGFTQASWLLPAYFLEFKGRYLIYKNAKAIPGHPVLIITHGI